jgi:hypothetical protein
MTKKGLRLDSRVSWKNKHVRKCTGCGDPIRSGGLTVIEEGIAWFCKRSCMLAYYVKRARKILRGNEDKGGKLQ